MNEMQIEISRHDTSSGVPSWATDGDGEGVEYSGCAEVDTDHRSDVIFSVDTAGYENKNKLGVDLLTGRSYVVEEQCQDDAQVRALPSAPCNCFAFPLCLPPFAVFQRTTLGARLEHLVDC